MQLTIREPGSAITHFIGCLMALIAASPLLIKAHGNTTYMLAMTIFATSMVLLYAASTIYHSICHVSAKVLRNFQKLDHMMIFVLIAGSYTPVCMIILGGRIGYTLLALVWGIAVAGNHLSKDSGLMLCHKKNRLSTSLWNLVHWECHSRFLPIYWNS